MSLPRIPHKKHLPSFSLVLTQSSPMGEPVEVLALNDFRDASIREVHVNFQPKDDDPLMKTVDTRFSGTSGYDTKHSTDNKSLKSSRTHVHVRQVSGSFSSLSSMVSTDNEDDATSSASTTELDLNREFEAELGFETDTDADTVFETDMEVTGPVPPLHRPPAALASLAQTPPFPPHRYRGFEEQNATSIPEYRAPGPVRPGSQNARPSHLCAPRSSRFARLKFLPSTPNLMFSALWRRLKKAGGLVRRGSPKHP